MKTSPRADPTAAAVRAVLALRDEPLVDVLSTRAQRAPDRALLIGMAMSCERAPNAVRMLALARARAEL